MKIRGLFLLVLTLMFPVCFYLVKSFGSQKSPEAIEAAKKQGVVARVYLHPIVLTQVDRRVEEDLWREGRSLEDLKPEEQLILRRAALNTLIDLHLLRMKVRFNQGKVEVTDAEIEAELDTFAKRFASAEEFQASLKSQGWSEKELRYRIAARIQQEKYLEHMIEVEVTEEQARKWFEESKDRLALPERVRARHIFLSTLNREPAAAQALLEAARGKIERKEAEFGALAKDLSEDERSKAKGGDLGWMHAGRLPEEFAAPLFRLEVGRVALVQSKIGYHLVEVLEKKPRSERSFEEARADVVAALEALKRTEGLKLYRQSLRYLERHQVEIFPDVLERGLDLTVKD
jgi:peptidyl-prolyl cis-trans isomerase C